MKEELIKLSREKGFMNRDNLVTVYDVYYPLWMCELQKWLREVHGIDIEIKTLFGKDGYKYGIIKHGSEDYSIYDIQWSTAYQTYEVALECALMEALKLIKS